LITIGWNKFSKHSKGEIFHGLVKFYKRSIKNFSGIRSALTDCMGKFLVGQRKLL